MVLLVGLVPLLLLIAATTTGLEKGRRGLAKETLLRPTPSAALRHIKAMVPDSDHESNPWTDAVQLAACTWSQTVHLLLRCINGNVKPAKGPNAQDPAFKIFEVQQQPLASAGVPGIVSDCLHLTAEHRLHPRTSQARWLMVGCDLLSACS